MARAEQPELLVFPEQPVVERPAAAEAPLKLRRVNRQQTTMLTLDVEALVSQDHKARAIWELVGRMDLSQFTVGMKTREGQAGREAWDPQLLVSLWVYAYSEGISSAREIERVMEWEAGFQWLAGLATVNHHTLSDFRVDHRAGLDELFAQLLGLLEKAGCLSLERVMHDGTKIRAQAGADTFRREATLKAHLERARAVVAQMGDPREEQGSGDGQKRKQAAQERAARERQERVGRAYEELQALQQEEQAEQDKQAVRVSLTEAEARMMKHGDNAMAPSYNAQISTDAQEKIIVGMHLSQCSSDARSLAPALAEVESKLGRRPEQVVVDGGFTSRDNIVLCERLKTDLIGSLPDPAERSAAAMKSMGIDPAFAPGQFQRTPEGRCVKCPAGHELGFVGQSRKRGNLYHQFRALGGECAGCVNQAKCCPRHAESGRMVSLLVEERAEVAAFRKKMAGPGAKQIYKQRGPVAEFPNAWIKEKLGLRKFRVRGLAKAGMELLWAGLTYNVMAWIRLCWRGSVPAGEYFTAGMA